MELNFVSFLSKAAQESEPIEIENISKEAISVARGFAGLKPSEFEEKYNSEQNGDVCLAWIAEYIFLSNGKTSGDEKWMERVSKNFDIAKIFFESWKPKKNAQIGTINGLFE